MARVTSSDSPATNGNVRIAAKSSHGAGRSVFVTESLYGLEAPIIGRLLCPDGSKRPLLGSLFSSGRGGIIENLFKEPYRTSTMLLLLNSTPSAWELLTFTSSLCRNAQNACAIWRITQDSATKRRKTKLTVKVPPTTSQSTLANKAENVWMSVGSYQINPRTAIPSHTTELYAPILTL